MGMSMAYGKTLIYKGSYIGKKSIVTYRDQNGKECKIDMEKYVALARKCKEERNKSFFEEWIPMIEKTQLAIGVPIIDGLNRIAHELGEEAYSCIIE